MSEHDDDCHGVRRAADRGYGYAHIATPRREEVEAIEALLNPLAELAYELLPYALND